MGQKEGATNTLLRADEDQEMRHNMPTGRGVEGLGDGTRTSEGDTGGWGGGMSSQTKGTGQVGLRRDTQVGESTLQAMPCGWSMGG